MIGGIAAVIVIIVVVVVIVVQRRKGKVDRSTESAQKRHEKESVAFENPLYSTKGKHCAYLLLPVLSLAHTRAPLASPK